MVSRPSSKMRADQGDQPRTSTSTDDVWLDNGYRIDHAHDALKIYFIRTPQNEVDHESFLNEDKWIKGAFDASGLLRYVSIDEASKRLPCHLGDDPVLDVDGKMGLQMSSRYSPGADVLTIRLVDPSHHRVAVSEATLDDGIVFDFDADGLLLAIEILYASSTVRKQ